MKKIISMALVLLLCLSMVLPVSATVVTGEFVPSVSYKENPKLVKAIFRNVEDGTTEDITDCIVITSVQEAIDKETDIKQEERDYLLKKYEDIQNGEVLPFNYDYVIVQLLDVNFKYLNCRVQDEHGDKPERHLTEEFVVEITFDFDLGEGAVVDVLKNYEGEWEAPVSVTNNPDGTVTVVYDDHFCPNAFAVKKSQNVVGGIPQTGDDNGAQLILWGSVFAVCVIGLGVVLVMFSKKRRNA